MCTEEAAVLALIMEVCGCQVLTQVLPGGCMVAKGQKIGLWVATIETVDVPKVAIWSPNVFRIRPHLAEKSTTLDITNSWNFWTPCRFGVFHHPAWAVGSYSSSPPAAPTVGTKSTGGPSKIWQP